MRPAKSPGLSAVQTGIFKAISGASITIYDEAPENAAFPYSTIGESNTSDIGTKTDNADDHFETIHVWSRAKGFKECKAMMTAIISAISGYAYAEAGYKIMFIELDQVNTFRDPDGLTRHGVIRAKFKVFQE